MSSRRRLGELLIEMGLIDEDRLLPFLGRRLGLPGTRLREGMVDPAVVRIVPRNVAERLCAIAMLRMSINICRQVTALRFLHSYSRSR